MTTMDTKNMACEAGQREGRRPETHPLGGNAWIDGKTGEYIERFSAEVSIRNIIHSYLWPYELATEIDKHTEMSYKNAIEHGAMSYVTTHYQQFGIMLDHATRYGQTDAMELFLRPSDNSHQYTFTIATEYNQVAAMKWLITYGAKPSTENFVQASAKGAIGAMKFLTSIGCVDVTNGIWWSARHGHAEAVKYTLTLIEIPMRVINRTICVASRYGHANVLTVLAAFGDTTGDHSACSAAECLGSEI